VEHNLDIMYVRVSAAMSHFPSTIKMDRTQTDLGGEKGGIRGLGELVEGRGGGGLGGGGGGFWSLFFLLYL
jgi:hypothetical protein